MPEGLPLALTMALTITSNKMMKKNCLVKKLNSVESLGSCTYIASDKTGTLTLNEQTAKKIVLPNNKTFDVTGIGYNFDGKIITNTKEEALVKECNKIKDVKSRGEALLTAEAKFNLWMDIYPESEPFPMNLQIQKTHDEFMDKMGLNPKDINK